MDSRESGDCEYKLCFGCQYDSYKPCSDIDLQLIPNYNQEKQLEQLTEGERKIRRRVEDIQDFLRRGNERLESEKAKETEEGHAGKDEDDEDMARPPNAEEGNEIEEVEMSDSMPPTPAVVLTEA